jgi:hypothetical protein
MQSKTIEHLAATLADNHNGAYAYDRKSGRLSVTGPVPFGTFLLLLSRFGMVRVETGWA